MSQINIEKTVFDKVAFDKVINRQFSQLSPANQTGGQNTVPTFTLEDFLALFETLFKPFLFSCLLSFIIYL